MAQAKRAISYLHRCRNCAECYDSGPHTDLVRCSYIHEPHENITGITCRHYTETHTSPDCLDLSPEAIIRETSRRISIIRTGKVPKPSYSLESGDTYWANWTPGKR